MILANGCIHSLDLIWRQFCQHHRPDVGVDLFHQVDIVPVSTFRYLCLVGIKPVAQECLHLLRFFSDECA